MQFCAEDDKLLQDNGGASSSRLIWHRLRPVLPR